METKKIEKSEKIQKPMQFSSSRNEEHATHSLNSKLIAIIRIGGEVKKKSNIVETLNRLRLKRKYTCSLINSGNKSLMGMLEEVKHYVAFGEIDKDILIKLIEKRAQIIKEPNKPHSSKVDVQKIAEELMNGKKLIDLGIKPFFRLHPPRGGIKSKLQYPKGILGNNQDDINKLIARML